MEGSHPPFLMEVVMVYSAITIEDIKEYLRLDDESEDRTLETILAASKAFVKNYTGLTIEELDKLEDMTMVIFILCAELYDTRQLTLDKNNMSPAAKMMLNLHCVNLV